MVGSHFILFTNLTKKSMLEENFRFSVYFSIQDNRNLFERCNTSFLLVFWFKYCKKKVVKPTCKNKLGLKYKSPLVNNVPSMHDPNHAVLDPFFCILLHLKTKRSVGGQRSTGEPEIDFLLFLKEKKMGKGEGGLR